MKVMRYPTWKEWNIWYWRDDTSWWKKQDLLYVGGGEGFVIKGLTNFSAHLRDTIGERKHIFEEWDKIAEP